MIGDRSSSDVVVRIRTHEGRDEWVYCHSNVLINKSKYFADRLSDNWPTCQILDSRNCVDIFCEDSDFDYYVTVLRLLYVLRDDSVADVWHGVKNSISTLRVSVELGCPQVIASCVEYLEAVPWEEAEEEEILKVIPGMGSQAEKILARLQPVNPSTISKIFVSATRFATSSLPLSLNGLKLSAQEQLEYMLTEDDDAPLLAADETIKTEVLQCVNRMFTRFTSLVDYLLFEQENSAYEAEKFEVLLSDITDLCWAWQILAKLEILRDFVQSWLEISLSVLKVVDNGEMLETKLKVIEVTAKVLEAVGYGTVILPADKRLRLVKIWLPFIRVVKPLVDTPNIEDEKDLTVKIDGEVWQSLESAIVSLILTLPSGDVAEILTDWLANEHVQYPDLTEAFEIWCYRSKAAKRRLGCLSAQSGLVDKI